MKKNENPSMKQLHSTPICCLEQLEPRLLMNADTIAAAINVGALSGTRVFNDAVSVTDVNDYFRFNLTSRGDLALRLTGLRADADVDLLNASGTRIAASTNGGTQAEAINRTLDPGTYYARVYRYSGNTAYSLSLTASATQPAAPSDGAGNTLAAARNIGTLNGSQSFQDFVGSADSNDYYRLNLAGRSNFSLGMSGLGADADVNLLDASGNVIASSANGGTNSEAISRVLDAGTYYVRVFPYSGSTNYNLTLNASAADTQAPTAALNNVSAMVVGGRPTGEFSVTYQDNVAVNVGTIDGGDIRVIGPNGFNQAASLVSINNNTNGTPRTATYRITAPGGTWDSADNGTYSVVMQANQVNDTSGNAVPARTLGSFSVNLQPPAPADGAGNGLSAARNIGTLSGTQSFADFVGSVDTNDYYRFSLASQSNFALAMTGLSADADVNLLDASGNVIASSANGGTNTESISRTLAAGTYYVRVYPYSGSTNYTLSLTGAAVQPTPPAPAGDTDDQISEATQMGGISTSRTTNGSINVGTDVDMFAVDVTAGQRISFDTDSNFDTYIRLFNASGTQLAANDDARAPGESSGLDSYLEYTFSQGGRYFLGVSGYGNSGYSAVAGSGDGNGRTGNYSLVVTNITPAPTPTDGAGNSLSAARNIGTLSGAQTLQGSVGSADANDYYRFSLTTRSNFSLGMNGMVADADIQLLDSNGNVIASSTNGGSSSESIARTLDVGTYYVRAYRYSGDTNFTLSLTSTPAGSPDMVSDFLLASLFSGATTAAQVGLGAVVVADAVLRESPLTIVIDGYLRVPVSRWLSIEPLVQLRQWTYQTNFVQNAPWLREMMQRFNWDGSRQLTQAESLQAIAEMQQRGWITVETL